MEEVVLHRRQGPHYQYSTFMQGMREPHGKEALWSELHGWREEVTSSKLTTGHTSSVFVGHHSRKLRSLSVCTDEKIKILKDLYFP